LDAHPNSNECPPARPLLGVRRPIGDPSAARRLEFSFSRKRKKAKFCSRDGSGICVGGFRHCVFHCACRRRLVWFVSFEPLPLMGAEARGEEGRRCPSPPWTPSSPAPERECHGSEAEVTAELPCGDSGDLCSALTQSRRTNSGGSASGNREALRPAPGNPASDEMYSIALLKIVAWPRAGDAERSGSHCHDYACMS
jgi:hypothetical protein